MATRTPKLLEVIDAALILPLLAAGIMAARHSPGFPLRFLVVLAGASLFCLVLAHGFCKRFPNAMLTLLALVLITIWPEVVVRLSGFDFDPRSVVRFGRPTPQELMTLESDPQLFWRPPPDRADVNAFGFFGPEFRIPKPPGVFRLLFFGDSCTQQGYPRGVTTKLGIARPGSYEFEAFNLGVAGYSSHQGRVIAARWAETFEPDLAIVLFGWNDHWLAWGATDKQKAERGYGKHESLWRVLSRSRLLLWVAKQRLDAVNEPLGISRVPLADYGENLVAIGDAVEAAGGRVLLLTSPSSHRVTGVPLELVHSRQAVHVDSVLAWHEKYNEVVRSVSQRQGWPLLDLAIRAQELENPAEYFMSDGIHFTRRGLDWMATQIAAGVISTLPGDRKAAHP